MSPRLAAVLVLAAALLLIGAHAFGSDLSPAPSSQARVHTDYADTADQVLSYSDTADTERTGAEDGSVFAPGEPNPPDADHLGGPPGDGASDTPRDHYDASPAYADDYDDDDDNEDDDYAALEDLVRTGEEAVRIEKDSVRGLLYFRAAGLLGHSGALSTAASMLLNGEHGIKRDISTAVRFLRLAAGAGQPDAQALLGVLHASGIADRWGVEKNAGKAILHWEFAAADGNAYAATALGFRYHYGIDVPADCGAAVAHYRRAASAVANDPAAWPSAVNFINAPPPLPRKLRAFETERLSERAADRVPAPAGGGDADDDVLHYYSHSAARGNREALTTLGALHLFGGQGLPRNERRGLGILRQAAAAGDGDAHAIVAHVGLRRRRDPRGIRAHFNASAASGNKHGHYALGMVHLHGLLGESVDFERALAHFTEAAELQHASASFQLGLMHARGQGVNASAEHAFMHYQQGARLGDVPSEFMLAAIFADGRRPVNEPKCDAAVARFKRVAEKGEWKAVFEAAMNAFDDHDDFGALLRFTRAAHAGIELGQYNAAMLLERRAPTNVPELAHWSRARFIDEATELYHLSSRQGHAEALVRAGNLAFLEKADYPAAVAAYEGGCKLKNPEAMFSLGWMYVRGLGVPQDRNLALRYLNLAKSTGAEALVPVSVALLFLRVYWRLRDVAASLGVDAVIAEQFDRLMASSAEWVARAQAQSSAKSLLAFTASQDISSDTVLVAGLALALVIVVMFRRWRMGLAEQDNEADFDEN